MCQSLLLYRRMGCAAPEDYVNWAVQLLQEGYDSPSLRILAGLIPKLERDDIEFYFTKVCEELDINIPDTEENTTVTALRIKQAYNLGDLSAEETVRLMARLHREAQYLNPLLCIWMDIDEELSLIGSGFEGAIYPVEEFDSLNDLVRQELEFFERSSVLQLSQNFNHFIRCNMCGHIGEPKLYVESFTSQGIEQNGYSCSNCNATSFRSMSYPDVRIAYLSQIESNLLTS